MLVDLNPVTSFFPLPRVAISVRRDARPLQRVSLLSPKRCCRCWISGCVEAANCEDVRDTGDERVEETLRRCICSGSCRFTNRVVNILENLRNVAVKCDARLSPILSERRIPNEMKQNESPFRVPPRRTPPSQSVRQLFTTTISIVSVRSKRNASEKLSRRASGLVVGRMSRRPGVKGAEEAAEVEEVDRR